MCLCVCVCGGGGGEGKLVSVALWMQKYPKSSRFILFFFFYLGPSVNQRISSWHKNDVREDQVAMYTLKLCEFMWWIDFFLNPENQRRASQISSTFQVSNLLGQNTFLHHYFPPMLNIAIVSSVSTRKQSVKHSPATKLFHFK